MPREKEVILLGSPCGTNFYPDGPQTLAEAKKEGDSFCPYFKKCESGMLRTHQCVMRMGTDVARFVIKQGNTVHGEVQGELRREFKEFHAPKGFIWSEDRKKFEIVKDKEKILELVEKFAVMLLGGQRFGGSASVTKKPGTTSQSLVSTDGVSINTMETARRAAEKVERRGGVPVHACGLESYGDCPCWTCTTNDCAACFASMY